MKLKTLPKSFLILFLLAASANAQKEVLTNADIVEMSKVGLGKQIILDKIKTSEGKYDTSAKGLVELKKAAVEDDVINALLQSIAAQKQVQTEVAATGAEVKNTLVDKKTRQPAELLRAAKTVMLRKNSIHPTLQALQKELLKRPDWQKLNLNITQQFDADLSVEIERVRFSIITHRYVFRVYDNKTGIVIAAGETTSWGSLAENMAREISKKLTQVSAD